MATGPVFYRYDLSVDSKVLDTNDTLQILGVTLDCKLNFAAYISEQVKKACAKASALRRIRGFIPLDIMGLLYKAYISVSFRILLSSIAWGWKKSKERLKTPIIIFLDLSYAMGNRCPMNSY